MDPEFLLRTSAFFTPNFGEPCNYLMKVFILKEIMKNRSIYEVLKSSSRFSLLTVKEIIFFWLRESYACVKTKGGVFFYDLIRRYINILINDLHTIILLYSLHYFKKWIDFFRIYHYFISFCYCGSMRFLWLIHYHQA